MAWFQYRTDLHHIIKLMHTKSHKCIVVCCTMRLGWDKYLYGSKTMKERNVCKTNVQRLPEMWLSLLQLVARKVVAPTWKVCKEKTEDIQETFWVLFVTHQSLSYSIIDLRMGGRAIIIRAGLRRYCLVCHGLEGNPSCDGGSRLKRTLMRNNKSSLLDLTLKYTSEFEGMIYYCKQ